ncbi:MAG: sugar porter family MFS transporter [Bacteroidales bacterium]|nr:sugar porter family MFS transporter [Bacteroidales bacterium]MBQ9722764.1 sugar porter family MFS transporter [Bacteroidales bacterium]
MKNTIGYVIFMAVVAAIGGILFGYDTAVISGTTSIVKNQFQLTDMMEGWYVGCALIGSIAGVLVAGSLSDYLGRKLTMLISAALFSISAIGCAVCGSFDSLVAFRIIGGVGIGIVSIVSPIYISEVSPAKIRGTLVSLYQLAVTIGFLLAYLMNWVIDSNGSLSVAGNLWTNMWNCEMWRGMLGSETLPALLFFSIIFFIPESPKWLIVNGKLDKASRVLNKIYATSDEVQEEIKITRESLQGEDKGKWSDLLKPGILLAVLAGSAIAILGQFMGVNAVLYYGPKIFSEAGFDNPMFSTVLVGVVNMVTTILAVFIIDRVGRKQLIYWGVSGMIICLLAIGIYFAWGTALGLGNAFMLTFFLGYVFCCAISISAIVFVLLSEMYPNSVRGRAMSIAGFALWIGTYLIGQLTPVLLGWSQAGTFFLFAVMCVPYMLIMWKVIPETTGKTLEEIEAYWTSRKK